MFTNSLSKKLVLTVTSLVAAGALALTAVFAPAAYAASPADDPTPTGPLNGAGLTYACQQEKLYLQAQQNRIDFSGQLATQAQTWIDTLKSAGKDTSSLEAALAAFNTAISTTQTQHNTAQSVYDAHAGLDGNCVATDRAQARITLETVRDDLRNAHRTISDGSLAFRLAVREWRRANRLGVGATATP